MAFELRNETGQQLTVFSDSLAAIDRAVTDGTVPGQGFAAAVIVVGEQIPQQGNSVTIRWTSAHEGVEGNETADAWAPAENRMENVKPGYLRETSLAHMRRVTVGPPTTKKERQRKDRPSPEKDVAPEGKRNKVKTK